LILSDVDTRSQCKHIVESTASNVETGAEVSELRFNLPTARQGHRADRGSVDLDSTSRTSPYLATSPGGRHQYSLSEPLDGQESPHWTSIRDDDGNIDYSLGRERAGGGFGGKQAKLGKLIVEYEGQKMLDLIVAANMALWFRAYERTL